MPSPSRPERPLLWLGKYLGLALTLPASVAAGFLVGAAADSWLHVPLLRAVGILLGMAAGILQVLKQVNRDSRDGETRK